jgi:senataxin
MYRFFKKKTHVLLDMLAKQSTLRLIPCAHILICLQYRMHPDISRFPSLHFYENKLLDGAEMAEKSASFHDHDYLGPYMFFDIADGREQCGRNAATQSLCNEFEADAALEILTFLKKR